MVIVTHLFKCLFINTMRIKRLFYIKIEIANLNRFCCHDNHEAISASLVLFQFSHFTYVIRVLLLVGIYAVCK